MTKEALKMALEALEQLDGLDTETECVTIDVGEVMDAIKAALAQPEQEPWLLKSTQTLAKTLASSNKGARSPIEVMTSSRVPPKRFSTHAGNESTKEFPPNPNFNFLLIWFAPKTHAIMSVSLKLAGCWWRIVSMR